MIPRLPRRALRFNNFFDSVIKLNNIPSLQPRIELDDVPTLNARMMRIRNLRLILFVFRSGPVVSGATTGKPLRALSRSIRFLTNIIALFLSFIQIDIVAQFALSIFSRRWFFIQVIYFIWVD